MTYSATCRSLLMSLERSYVLGAMGVRAVLVHKHLVKRKARLVGVGCHKLVGLGRDKPAGAGCDKPAGVGLGCDKPAGVGLGCDKPAGVG
eukprot:scaffold11522_cov24-Tisochrysis_lutea.AAC.3